MNPAGDVPKLSQKLSKLTISADGAQIGCIENGGSTGKVLGLLSVERVSIVENSKKR